VTSSCFFFFGYHKDARSNKHHILTGCSQYFYFLNTY